MKKIEFYLFQLFKWIVLALPLKSAQRLGYFLGSLSYYLVSGRRKIAFENLQHAFPEKSESERNQIAKGAFRNFAISFVELLWFPNLTDEIIRRLVRIRNPEIMIERCKQGRGMVMLAGHFGNWELTALAVAYLTKIPVTIIVQTQSNEYVDEVLNRHRCLFDNKVVPRGLAVREIIRTLQIGGVIAIAPDQSGPMEGVFVEFFGRLVATHQGPAAFALQSGAPMQMGFMLRQVDGSYEVILQEIPTSDIAEKTDENIKELTRRYTALLEQYIRQYPDHWLWLHRRWKHTWESVQREKETPAQLDKMGIGKEDHQAAPSRYAGSGRKIENILVVQTAFLGDVVLTLPLVQVVKRFFPEAKIDFLTAPRGAGILKNHSDIETVIEFDKNGKDSGVRGLFRVTENVRKQNYDVAIVPHRSLRSALLVWRAKIPQRIGFHKSAGRFFFTNVVRYENTLHEIDRNISLLNPLDISWKQKELPRLYPAETDITTVDELLRDANISDTSSMIAIAPGTMWNTKRWLKERYAELVERFVHRNFIAALIGGREDKALCEEIARSVSEEKRIFNAAGGLSLLQSAELLRRCRLLVCNDSAPMHLAVAMRTPVVAIFGATIPEFGFAPYGKYDVVVETEGLNCRPCSIHGGDRCPIRTFVCMKEITSEKVYHTSMRVLNDVRLKV